ncbi:MAG TPA: hypothetical protein PKB14_11215 [Rubrivivax sp.]|nr:hypothetical protein [Rubrivivax sp.]
MPSSSLSGAEPTPAPSSASDDRLPLARGADRLRLLYTLPLRREPSTTLLVGSAGDAACRELRSGWPGTVAVSESWQLMRAATALGRPRYDAVLLPGVLGVAGHAPAGQVSIAALALLRPGGTVVGHMPHLMSVHGLRRGRVWRPGSDWATPGRVARSLLCAGFIDAECFLIEPHAASPMALVPSARKAAGRHFVLAVRRTRNQHGRLGYGLRLLAARCGLGGLLQPDLFFWAHAPC